MSCLSGFVIAYVNHPVVFNMIKYKIQIQMCINKINLLYKYGPRQLVLIPSIKPAVSHNLNNPTALTECFHS
jgi:hypothetical protein